MKRNGVSSKPQTAAARDPYAYLREKTSPLSLLTRFLKGVMVGIGFILPGLSGGVLAVIFGIYDPLMRFLGNLRTRFAENVKYFIPFVIGAGVGVYLFSVVVEAAFGRYAALFTCLFIGFVLGTLPQLFRTAGRLGREPRHWWALLASGVIVFLLMMLGDKALISIEPNPAVWFAAGGLIGLGVIVPGLSPSNFLIYFNLYDKMASEIKAFKLSTIIPLGLGLVMIVLLLAKLVNRLFERHETMLYHVILGSIIGSSAAIIPTVVAPALNASGLARMDVSLGAALAWCAVLLLAGAVLSYLFGLLERRVEADRPKENGVTPT